MTTIDKELNSDHIIGYGVKLEGNSYIVRFQFHPIIEEWLKSNKIVPNYSVLEEVPGYTIDVSGYETDRNISFKESELRNSRHDVIDLLQKIRVSVPLTKHQYKFKFPVFKETPKLSLSRDQMNNLVSDGVWTHEILIKNTVSA